MSCDNATWQYEDALKEWSHLSDQLKNISREYLGVMEEGRPRPITVSQLDYWARLHAALDTAHRRCSEAWLSYSAERRNHRD